MTDKVEFWVNGNLQDTRLTEDTTPLIANKMVEMGYTVHYYPDIKKLVIFG